MARQPHDPDVVAEVLAAELRTDAGRPGAISRTSDLELDVAEAAHRGSFPEVGRKVSR